MDNRRRDLLGYPTKPLGKIAPTLSEVAAGVQTREISATRNLPSPTERVEVLKPHFNRLLEKRGRGYMVLKQSGGAAAWSPDVSSGAPRRMLSAAVAGRPHVFQNHIPEGTAP